MLILKKEVADWFCVLFRTIERISIFEEESFNSATNEIVSEKKELSDKLDGRGKWEGSAVGTESEISGSLFYNMTCGGV